MIVLLIKYSITIAIVLLFYKVFLTKESFYTLNRLYLMVTLLITFLLPFISIPKLVSHQGIIEEYVEQVSVSKSLIKNNTKNISNTNDGSIEKIAVSTSSNYDLLVMTFSDWILVIYGIGVVIFIINFIIQLIGIFILILKNDDRIDDEGFTIINLKKFKEPCSFFNYIFIHPESYDHDTYEQIIAHEKIHIKNRHTIDLLLAELSLVLLWFFPLMWIFRKEVEKNIEYQTDELLLRNNTIDKDNYQMNLLKVAIHNKPLSLTTNYNQSLIKQRIMKMSAKKSNPLSFYKYLFVTPTLLLFILLINKPQMVNAQTPPKQVEKAVENAFNPNEKTISNVNNDLKFEKNSHCQELLTAISNENIPEIKKLLEHGNINCLSSTSEYDSVKVKNITYKFKQPRIPITRAAKIGNIEIAKLLIANGANLKAHEGSMRTPLIIASEYGNLDFIKYLITQQVELDLKTKEDALISAARNGHLEVVKYFLSMGAKINVTTINGTALSNASRNGYLETIKYLISQGAEVDKETPADGTALIAASRNGNLESVKYLLSQGAKIDEINEKGTALSNASRNGHLETVKYLISQGAEVNKKIKIDGTALIAGARNGKLETVKYLISQGAEINMKTEYKETALSAARRNEHLETVKYLISQGAK